MKNLIAIILLTIILFSCSRIVGRMLGVNPKVESANEQLNYLNKIEIDTAYNYNFNSAMEDSISAVKYNLDTFQKAGYSPIQFRMYNNEGDFIGGWASCYGSLKRLQALDSFPLKFNSVKHLPLNYNLTFQQDLNLIDSKSTLSSENIKNYDVIIIAFWAESMGKFSNDMMVNLNNYVKRNSEKEILFIKVNYSNIFKE